MVNSEQFGKRLEKIMDEYDLNATSFADEINVGRSSISHILSGRNKPSLEFVMKVVEAFPEVELYWLLNGKGSFPKRTTPADRAADTQKSLERDLFSENEQPKTAPVDLVNQPDTRQISDSDKQIDRIVIFYKDGTFKSFLP